MKKQDLYHLAERLREFANERDWEKFSLEMLISLVTKAGMHVKLKIAA